MSRTKLTFLRSQQVRLSFTALRPYPEVVE